MTEWYNKKNNKLLLAFVINLLVMGLFLLLYYPVYETNDDSAILSFASGAYGVYDAHLIYQNYLLGWLYIQLYQLNHVLPWYALIQYMLLFVSFTALTFILMEYLESPSFLWIILIILLFFGFDTYVKIQYTKTAGILSAAGLTLVLMALMKKKVSLAEMSLGVVLAWLGSLYRVQQFFCVAAFFAAPAIYLLLNIKEFSNGKTLKRAGTAVAAGLVLLLCTGGAAFCDRMQYQSDSWSEYLRYNDLRTELLDYGFPLYDGHSKEYDRIGLDKSAVMLLRRWTFEDDERFNTEVFESIINMKGNKPHVADQKFFHDYFRDLADGLKEREVFWCFALLLPCCILLSRHSYSKWIAAGILTVILLGIYGYLYYRGRFMIRRVDVGIWFAAVSSLLMIFKPERKHKAGLAGFLVLAVLAICMNFKWNDFWRINSREKAEESRKERESVQMVHSDLEHLYLRKVDTISLAKAFGVFEQCPFGIAENTYALGGWPSHTETARSVLDNYRAGNPFCFRNMINNDGIYLVDKKN